MGEYLFEPRPLFEVTNCDLKPMGLSQFVDSEEISKGSFITLTCLICNESFIFFIYLFFCIVLFCYSNGSLQFL